jgi:hypothetical protein
MHMHAPQDEEAVAGCDTLQGALVAISAQGIHQ